MSDLGTDNASGHSLVAGGKKRKRKRSNKSKNIDERSQFREKEPEIELQGTLEMLKKSKQKDAFDDDKIKQQLNGSVKGKLSEWKQIQLQKDPPKSASQPRVSEFYSREGDYEDQEETYHKANGFTKAQLAKRAQELLAIRKSLPIYQHRDEIVNYIKRNQVTVILGETGSGKSTQIPQFLVPFNKQVAISQPRRVAAASLATRVSEEYGCQVGQEVGYQVRFSNFTHPLKTKLKYLTDGMLLREIMIDPLLKKYSTVIIDEAHERTILTDLILGFLKELIKSKKRQDLKVVVMSATLNAQLFSKFFDDAPILYIEGRTYPVSKFYLEDQCDDIIDTMIRSIVQINMGESEGDILCFLPGQDEIDNCVRTLEQIAPLLPKEAPFIVPLPLYAALSPSQQAKIFQKLPGRKRKVILATNIAETSITVSGVKYVIDSGLRKVKVWKHQLGLSTLLTTPISQASAKQRAGRAGRESHGKAFRLYLEKVYSNNLPKQQESEIMRNDIILPILTLKKIGVTDLLNWSWLENPGQEAILGALNTLYSLGALNDSGKITSLGSKMAILPLLPQLSASLLTAFESRVIAPVIDIVACLSVDNLILNVHDRNGELRDEINIKRRQYCPLGCHHGDLIALMEYYNCYLDLSEKGSAAAKSWCEELYFSYKGFKNVSKVRAQLRDYMIATIKQDNDLSALEKESDLRNLKAQFNNSMETEGELQLPLEIPSILKSFLKGYITNTAIGMPDRSYRTLTTGQLISIHPSSNLFGKVNLDVIMYMEYVYTTKAYGRTCSLIEASWLQEVAPHILGTAKVNAND
ncbi:uncharacterized protein PRCAT00006285001 [Priceomyces carsonii]|uniref:uncharacterized protein n=1 Tax=Priceomyces carsonii TaxID=28549 RepID=UPI002ED7F187|nr:unnamed protein product [Priceomyces carsonii]